MITREIVREIAINFGIDLFGIASVEKFDPDPLATYEACPPRCRICLDNCPQNALIGESVIQKKCRPISNFKTEKGYIIKKCFECRKKCPHALGINYC